MKKLLLFTFILNILIINMFSQSVLAAPKSILDDSKSVPTGPDAQTSTQTQTQTQTSTETEKDLSIDDIFSGGDSFLTEIYKDQDPKTEGGQALNPKVDEITDKLVPFSISLSNVFITIGTILAVIYASVLGIKFMMGAAEEKAEVKESLIPFVIGCAVVYGAFFIWKLVINIGKSF